MNRQCWSWSMQRSSSAGLIGEGFFSARATHYRERLQAKRRWLTGGGVHAEVDLDFLLVTWGITLKANRLKHHGVNNG